MYKYPMKEHNYYVYILASRPHGAIYIGVTNDLAHRVREHRSGRGSHHTSKYKIFHLVYWEHFGNIDDAITREKRLKKWNRAWKNRIVEERNPNWDDLYAAFCQEGG